MRLRIIVSFLPATINCLHYILGYHIHFKQNRLLRTLTHFGQPIAILVFQNPSPNERIRQGQLLMLHQERVMMGHGLLLAYESILHRRTYEPLFPP